MASVPSEWGHVHPRFVGYTLRRRSPASGEICDGDGPESYLSGGFGRVYQATKGDRVLFAIKVLDPSRSDPDTLVRWTEECRVARTLPRHENLVTIIDLVDAQWPDGRVVKALVMPWLSGSKGLIAKADELGLDKVARVALLQQACAGVAAIHSLGIPHGDLKSGNMLVIDGPDGPIVKVTDYGGTRLPRGLDPSSPVFTPSRAAPEMWGSDPSAIGTAADQYSLAKELAELVGGSAATDPPGGDHRLWRASPLERFIGLPDRALEAIIARNTQEQPSLRDPTAKELGAALKAYRPPLLERVARRLERLLWPVAQRSWEPRSLRPALALLLVATFAAILAVLACRTAIVQGLGPPITLAAVPPWRMDRVAVVQPRSAEELSSLAQQLGIEGVDVRNPYSYRLVWGRVLRELAMYRPRIIGLDIVFKRCGDPALDAAIAESISAVRGAKRDAVPVVIATFDASPERPDQRGADSIDTGVLEAASGSGHYLLEFLGGRGLSVVVAQADGRVARLPFSMAMVVAAERDGAFATLDSASETLRVMSEAGEEFVVALSSVIPEEEQLGERVAGTSRGDVLGFLSMAPPPDSELEAITISVEELFAADDASRARLAARLFDRFVIVAAHSPEDVHSVDGREVPGPWLHATALQSALLGAAARRVELGTVARAWPAALGGVVAGLVAAAWALRRLGLTMCTLTGAWGRTPVPTRAAARRWRLAIAVATTGVLATIALLLVLPKLSAVAIAYPTALIGAAGLAGLACGAAAALTAAWMSLVRRAWGLDRAAA